jgi:hypothetical protein
MVKKIVLESGNNFFSMPPVVAFIQKSQAIIKSSEKTGIDGEFLNLHLRTEQNIVLICRNPHFGPGTRLLLQGMTK